jgi:ABC-type Fe3+ transport system permease subunit
MRYRKMLISSIILMGVGVGLWFVIGPVVMVLGIETGSYETSSFFGLFTETHFYQYATPTFYLGLALALGGIIILIVGIILAVIVAVLEFTKNTSLKPSKEATEP